MSGLLPISNRRTDERDHTMAMESIKYSPRADVIDTILNEKEASLMHIGTQSSFALNQTGLKIWNLLKEGVGLDEIAEELAETFDVGLERATQDTMDLIENLLAFDLITPVE